MFKHHGSLAINNNDFVTTPKLEFILKVIFSYCLRFAGNVGSTDNRSRTVTARSVRPEIGQHSVIALARDTVDV
jgi:hypothetical protein